MCNIHINLINTCSMKTTFLPFYAALLFSAASFSRSSEAYRNVRPLTELNDPKEADAYPCISADGLRLYFTKCVDENNELMFAQRVNTSANFSTVTNSYLLNLNRSCT